MSDLRKYAPKWLWFAYILFTLPIRFVVFLFQREPRDRNVRAHPYGPHGRR